MSKFTQKKARSATINTSALPDIIFMLLFFFMVVTVLRDSQLLLKIQIPKASQAKEIVHRSLVHHIYIGRPIDEQHGTAPIVQINDAFVKVEEVGKAVKGLVARLPETRQNLATTSLRVDKSVEMGIVSDVKIALRKAQQFKLNYAARKP